FCDVVRVFRSEWQPEWQRATQLLLRLRMDAASRGQKPANYSVSEPFHRISLPACIAGLISPRALRLSSVLGLMPMRAAISAVVTNSPGWSGARVGNSRPKVLIVST